MLSLFEKKIPVQRNIKRKDLHFGKWKLFVDNGSTFAMPSQNMQPYVNTDVFMTEVFIIVLTVWKMWLKLEYLKWYSDFTER